MKVAVIGGLGFIGSRLVEKLNQSDYDTHVLDLKDASIDIRDKVSVDRCIERIKPDYVYCTAALIRMEECYNDISLATETNVQGLINVLQACRDYNVKRILFSSTTHVYEGMTGRVDEDTEIDISSRFHPYTYTKLAGELAIRSFNYMYGLPYTIFRYGITYGPRGHKDMVIHRFISQAKRGENLIVNGSLDNKRTYVHIDDLIRGKIMCLCKPAENETINLCNSTPTSIGEVIDIINKNIPCRYTIGVPRDGDFSSPVIMNKKALALINWKPEIDIETGILKSIL